MINVRNLNKYYNKGKNNEIHVINDISLNLPNTGLIALLGQSGSGKTTLLNIIGGLDKATGTITYDDVEIKNYQMKKVDNFRKEHIGYVFQNYNLLGDKTIWQNLEIALEVIDITDKEEVKKRIEYCLKAVGLYKFRRKMAFALSGGQMQRVSIARALVKNSKIIIADEPTGNLDSDNSVEIMNILKKISQKALVLLVTHDQQLAEFFADQIIEITDGRVQRVRETLKGASLTGKTNDNIIYLQDLEVKTGESDNFKYQIYSDSQMEELSFTIVKRNNQLYLQSNQKIKLIDDTPLQLVNQKSEEISKEEVIDNFNYDTSWFNETKSVSLFKRIMTNLKNSFRSFFKSRKKTKFFYFVFFLIGILVAFLNITYSIYSRIDTSTLIYDRDVYCVYNPDSFLYNDSLHKAYEDSLNEAMEGGLITNLYLKASAEQFIMAGTNMTTFNDNRSQVNAYKFDARIIENETLLIGNKPTKMDEVVISTKLADRILSQYTDPNFDYSSLISLTVSDSDYESPVKYYKIVGIVDKDAVAYYAYTEYFLTGNLAINDEPAYQTGPRYYPYEQGKYKVIYGEDLTSDDLTGCLLFLEADEEYTQDSVEDSFNYYKENPFTISDTAYEIRGVVQLLYENEIHHYPFIVNNPKDIYSNSPATVYGFYSDKYAYTVCTGRDIQNLFEGLAPAYSNYQIGDKIGGITIVGKYSFEGYDNFGYDIIDTDYDYKDYPNNSLIFVDNITASYLRYNPSAEYQYYRDYCFTTNDSEKLKQIFSENGFEVVDLYEDGYRILLEESQTIRTVIFPVMILLIVIITIYIYFSMRSKMVNDIYSIGVYRALGFSRTRIVFKNLFDIIIITFFTTLLGYLLTSLIYEYIANNLLSKGVNMAKVFDYWSIYAIFGLMVALNVIIGLLPVSGLMKKTPSEIIAKYDI